jgi:hypothetical protein
MAEMVGLSHTAPRRNGSVFGLIGLLRAVWPKKADSGSQIHTEEWSDYMLRDVGLQRDQGGRPSLFDWPTR